MESDYSIDFVKAYRHRAGQRVADQSHTCYELVYYWSGSGTTTIGDETFVLRPNTFSLIRPKVIHSETHTDPSHVLFIGFRGTVREPEHTVFFSDSPDRRIGETLRSLYEEWLSGNSDSMEIMLLKLRLLLCYVYRIAGIAESAQKESRMRFAANYIKQYCTGTIDWRELADSYHYSYDHFHHLFKDEIGMSPTQYQIRARLEMAKKLLEKGELNCTEIAYRCGFSNSAHLSSQFRRAFHLSPREFRKNGYRS